MKSISEAISNNADSFTRGQRLLASFITEHCDKAAFMSSFELADFTGVSQSTVIRFSLALGYDTFTSFQQALREELKYRLNALERFEYLTEDLSDDDVVSRIVLADSRNIKKNLSDYKSELLQSVCSRILLADKIYVYGQGASCAASIYLSSYLNNMLPNVSCINQMNIDPLSAISQIDEGDLLILISFPVHLNSTLSVLKYAKAKNACRITISESATSTVADLSDIALSSEYGEYGINGTLAPVISLCGAIVCVLARSDERFAKKLHNIDLLNTFSEEEK